jgi:integrase
MIAGAGLSNGASMRGKITKRAVDAMRPGGSDQFLWDTEIKGFGLKVTPADKRVYILQYRSGGRGTPTKRVTIGSHGALTPEGARAAAQRLAGAIANGADPAEAKALDKAAPTVADLAARFVTGHVATKTKARTAVEYRHLLDAYVLPALGRIRVSDVTRKHVTDLHHSLRAKPYAANRTLAVLSKMFNLAEKWGERADRSNPCRHVEKYPERKRERFLSEVELARLGEELTAAERDSAESPFVVGAIRLLVFTGARRNEILTLRWEHIDFERTCLRLSDSKTGAKSVHLNAPALELLAAMPRIEGNPFVIPGERPGAHLVNIEKPWRRIRARAGLDGVRLHDLRHSFASFGAGAGLGLPIIGALLGHTQAATTARYAHLAADPLKQASERIGREIAAAMQGKRKEEGEVVALKRTR